MALYLLPTANDTIGTTVLGATSQSVTSAYTIPKTLSLKMTCKKDQIEINGKVILSYTANLGSSATAYKDVTVITIYRGTPSTGTVVYTTNNLIRNHYGTDGPTETWVVPFQFIEYPAMLNTENTVNYYITVSSIESGGTAVPVYLQQYTVSAREIPYCDR
ncbi:hypothetical protein [Clostridium sp. D53t1_180928_C8]|uniref:hypothetical protein n=1 Tax=Clostridium sp. D53t1_180928_C8 TaxID=2787101 RepID=UPI0018ABBF68|nr:hypothetical protein [Clostridium sp. D53t1_180928_C8]